MGPAWHLRCGRLLSCRILHVEHTAGVGLWLHLHFHCARQLWCPLENLLPETALYCKWRWRRARERVLACTGDNRVLFLNSNLLCFGARGLWNIWAFLHNLDARKTSLCRERNSIVWAKGQTECCAGSQDRAIESGSYWMNGSYSETGRKKREKAEYRLKK